MTKKITAVLLAIIGICLFGKHKGKHDENKQQNENNIKQVKSSRRIKNNIEKLNADERANYYNELLNNADR